MGEEQWVGLIDRETEDVSMTTRAAYWAQPEGKQEAGKKVHGHHEDLSGYPKA